MKRHADPLCTIRVGRNHSINDRNKPSFEVPKPECQFFIGEIAFPEIAPILLLHDGELRESPRDDSLRFRRLLFSDPGRDSKQASRGITIPFVTSTLHQTHSRPQIEQADRFARFGAGLIIGWRELHGCGSHRLHNPFRFVHLAQLEQLLRGAAEVQDST